jgi:hypothetical protein
MQSIHAAGVELPSSYAWRLLDYSERLLDALDAAEARIAAVEALARGWLALPHGHYGPATAIVRDRARDVLNAIGIEEGT